MTVKVKTPRTDLGYVEGTTPRIRIAHDIEVESDTYKTREQLESEAQVLRERLLRRGQQVTELSHELSRAQDFGAYTAELSNAQASIIEAVVGILHTEIAGGRRKTSSRARTRQILAEEIIEAISESAGYNVDFPPILDEGDATVGYVNQE